MGFLFGGSKSNTPQSETKVKVTGVQVQTSVYGATIPVIYGRVRLAGNLIWLGSFQKKTKEIEQEGGKGGGGGGGGGKGGVSSEVTTYSTDLMMALCHGPDVTLRKVWVNKGSQDTSSSGLGFASGGQAQTVWSHLTDQHSSNAIGYSGIAYVRAAEYQLGSDPNLPMWNFEVSRAQDVVGVDDANPSSIITDILTNATYGAGFPSALLSLTTYSDYCLAAGLLLSPAFSEQTEAADILSGLSELTNSAVVWTGTQLKLIPYGDENLSGNGATYTAPSAPLFDLDDDDFLDSDQPVKLIRKRPADNYNKVSIEYSNRAKKYDISTVEASDLGAIELYGERSEGTIDGKAICTQAIALFAAQSKLQRYAFRNEYQFTLSWRYCMLECMDIVTITDAALGLDRQWVRILEINEDDEGRLEIRAEEYLRGTGHPATYSYENADGYFADQEGDPGDTNAPVFISPPSVLLGGAQPEVWVALSGGADWGGCDIYISPDDTTYKFAARHTAKSRYGTLSAQLPSGSSPDSTNTLSVDLSVSGGSLYSGTQDDADALVTLCYVDGEYLAYETATLTGTNAYDLTYLVRGAYGSSIGAHAIGSTFVRIDDRICRFEYPQEYIGSPFYAKFVSVNIYGQGAQDISDVTAYVVTPGGYTVPPVTSLQVKGGGTEFAAVNCHLEWTAPVGAAEYILNIYNTSDVLKRTERGAVNSYVYDLGRNREDFGSPAREFKVGVIAVDRFGKQSAETKITVSNPEPSMSGVTPTFHVRGRKVSIDWESYTEPADIWKYLIYCDANNPPTTVVARAAAGQDTHTMRITIPRGTVYYARILPYDQFGAGTTSTTISSTGQAFEWGDIEDPRSGDGKNRLPLRYSTFENRRLPAMAVSNITKTLESSLSAFDTRCLKTVAGADNAYLYLSSTSTNYNIRLAPNRRWLVSAYVRATTSNVGIKFGLSTATTQYYSSEITIASADTWYRKEAMLDLLADTNRTAVAILMDCDNGTTVYWDAVMVEEYLGDETNLGSSPFTYGEGGFGAIGTESIEPDGITEEYTDSDSGENLVTVSQVYTLCGPSGDFELISGDKVALAGQVETVEGTISLRIQYSDNGGTNWTTLVYQYIAADSGGTVTATDTISSSVTRQYRLSAVSPSLGNNYVTNINFSVKLTKR